jgi:hypothetical protein
MAPPTAIPMMAPRGRPDVDSEEFAGGGTVIESVLTEIVASLKVAASFVFRSDKTLAANVVAEALRVAPIDVAEATLSVVIFVVTSRLAFARRLAVKMTFLVSILYTRETFTVDFESSFAALAIEASRLAIPEAFWKAVSGMFEKLKTTWTTGSVARGGFSEGAAGLTEAFADGEGVTVDEGVDVLVEQTVSLVALHVVSTTCKVEQVVQVLQVIESAVAEHVPPL